jgi:NADH dehydrogenase
MVTHHGTDRRPHVVILGGGFGGLYAARALARVPVRVTLLDRKNHHLFQPLLYQVATAGLNPSDIASPIRRILRDQKNATVELARAVSIDTKEQRVVLDDGSVDYDYLIVATGARHSYFAHPEWEASAPGLKSVEDALEMRRRVLLAFERADRETDPNVQRAWLTFVIVGGGPTGVELAGALAELAHHVLKSDFRHIDPRSARILLVEGTPRLLGSYASELSDNARETLTAMGVTVHLETKVKMIDEEGVEMGDERIAAKTVLWAAGVKASPLADSLGVPLDGAGRVKVSPDLSVPGAPEVFVVGDLAIVEQDGAPVPGVAPAAMQGGAHAAKMIARRVQGRGTTPFHYLDKGSLATIGRAAAVAEIGQIRLTGLVAWLAWLLIHIVFLIGFKNRLLVLLQWAWAYFAYDRGARVITQPWAAPKGGTRLQVPATAVRSAAAQSAPTRGP